MRKKALDGIPHTIIFLLSQRLNNWLLLSRGGNTDWNSAGLCSTGWISINILPGWEPVYRTSIRTGIWIRFLQVHALFTLFSIVIYTDMSGGPRNKDKVDCRWYTCMKVSVTHSSLLQQIFVCTTKIRKYCNYWKRTMFWIGSRTFLGADSLRYNCTVFKLWQHRVAISYSPVCASLLKIYCPLLLTNVEAKHRFMKSFLYLILGNVSRMLASSYLKLLKYYQLAHAFV